MDSRFVPVSIDAFCSRRPPSYRVKGVLSETGLAAIYGTSAHGKTVFTLDLVLHIASGKDWNGHPVKRGRVVYVLAEGEAGFSSRLKAAIAHNDLSNPDLGIVACAPNLNFDSLSLIETIKATGGADVIVVDTLSRVIAGLDENGSAAMGSVIAFSELANRELKALVILVHHKGKSDRGLRGHSSLEAACDQIVLVEKTSTGSIARVEKHKDCESGAEWHFRIEPREVGLDEDLEPVTAPVPIYTSAPAPKAVGKWQTAVISAMGANEQMNLEDLIKAVKAKTSYDGDKDRRREAIVRAIENMSDLLVVKGGTVHVR